MKPVAQLVQNLALVFMIYEFIKMFFPKFIWEQAKISWLKSNTKGSKPEGNQRVFLQRKNPVLTMMGGIYLIFLLLTFFTPWWWIGLLMIALSTACVGALKPMMMRNAAFTKHVFLVLLLDFIFTFGLLSLINPTVINFLSNL